MGPSKDYIALPQSEKELNSSIPPPPYEEKHTRFPLCWKVVCLLLTFVGLIVVGFCIHPDREHGPFEKVDLGFPHDIQQHNHAQEALTGLMTRIVLEAEHGYPPPPPAPPSHNLHPHPHHHNRHGKHHGNYHPSDMDIKDQPSHHNHHHHHHHHHSPEEYESHHDHPAHSEHHHRQNHHHHQKREDDETVYIQKLPTHNRYQPPQKRDNDETVYIQKLPTHNRYQPPSKHTNHQRREIADALTGGKQQQWSQSYRLSPSANTSLHILSAHVHSSSMGNIRIRQDTTGIEQDIVINFRTTTFDGAVPVEISTNNFGDAFFVRARSAPVHDSTKDYSIDIIFPSSMTTMKKLNIHVNNGTIRSDNSLQVTFDSVKFSIIQGAMSVQKLTADRIMLGTYSGVIAGTFQPNTTFAVGAYYGHSNVRLLQSSAKSNHCRHLHIAASSPHGVSELTLEHGAFNGQFVAYRTLEHAPKVNFTTNDKQLYEYQVEDQLYSGWFINNTAANQLIIHGADETALTFE